jgi:hypothetical protein
MSGPLIAHDHPTLLEAALKFDGEFAGRAQTSGG